jgi:hypothetical protein
MSSQLLIMVLDTDIRKVVNSWFNDVDRIMIFVDKNTTDKNLKKILDIGVGVSKIIISVINFKDFSQARNRCLELSNDIRYKWTIFVDDSYELVGKLDLRNFEQKMLLIEVKDGHCEYYRPIVFQTDMEFKYEGLIHERINYCGTLGKIKNCHIFDKLTDSSIVRSLSRAWTVATKSSSIHHRSMGYFQLFITNRINVKTFVLNYECRCEICRKMLSNIRVTVIH